nr:immunoglobulin heavy chain junction region [Macaca mulatta]MOW24946.1 immunoglobulin heavy chain junction region [Macaca mulatta]MOW26979.1 immunoglobulin heavy chain junction region [Macaca mulatta]
CAEWERFDVW